MSKILKIIIWIIVIAIVVGGIWWWYSSSQQTQSSAINNSLQNQNAQNVQPASQKDTSDAALNSDLSSIDSQMKNLNADSTSVNQSLNQ